MKGDRIVLLGFHEKEKIFGSTVCVNVCGHVYTLLVPSYKQKKLLYLQDFTFFPIKPIHYHHLTPCGGPCIPKGRKVLGAGKSGTVERQKSPVRVFTGIN